MLGQRATFLSGSVTEEASKNLIAQLLYLDMESPGTPITLYICSGGGLVYAGLAIYDVMQYIQSPVHTVAIGHAESMAAILLCAGAKGHRSALPSARVMLHEPSLGVSRNTSTDVMIQVCATPRVRTWAWVWYAREHECVSVRYAIMILAHIRTRKRTRT